MQYLISFLEGIVTFISPCMLPMLPLYIMYFSAGKGKKHTFINSCGFVIGFSIIFIALGALASTFGAFLSSHETLVNIISGGIVVLFGLNFAGFLNIPFLNRTLKAESSIIPDGFFSAILFGMVFAVGYSPCVGTFLGSALMMASQQGSVMKGITMLTCYSLGLGLPFIMCGLLLERLQGTFDFIKNNYKTINRICGLLLIIVGIFMMSGKMGDLLGLLS